MCGGLTLSTVRVTTLYARTTASCFALVLTMLDYIILQYEDDSSATYDLHKSLDALDVSLDSPRPGIHLRPSVSSEPNLRRGGEDLRFAQNGVSGDRKSVV